MNLVHILPHVKAIGLSGSYARQCADALSDVDFCVYIENDEASAPIRRNAYSELGLTDFIYFDVDFEQCHGDGLHINGIRCDVAWFRISKVRSFLQALEVDFDCQEGLPGALSTLYTLYDPSHLIRQLQAEIPCYPDERARYRITQTMKSAYYSLHALGWLKKAAFRQDYFSFLKYTYNLLDRLFYIWFALNHTWYSEEKRLEEYIKSFSYVPAQAAERIQSIIMHQERNKELRESLISIKQLFGDTVTCSHQRYPDLDVPVNWME